MTDFSRKQRVKLKGIFILLNISPIISNKCMQQKYLTLISFTISSYCIELIIMDKTATHFSGRSHYPVFNVSYLTINT